MNFAMRVILSFVYVLVSMMRVGASVRVRVYLGGLRVGVTCVRGSVRTAKCFRITFYKLRKANVTAFFYRHLLLSVFEQHIICRLYKEPNESELHITKESLRQNHIWYQGGQQNCNILQRMRHN